MDINRFGLSREIPAKVKRAVRQNSRFGCVLCRSAVYTYEHIEPQFVDALNHDPDRIALLCPTCHALVTKKRIPKERVVDEYHAIRNSLSAKRPSDQEFFIHYGSALTVNLGSCNFSEFRSIINIDGVDVLSYKKCNESGAYVVTGIFYNEHGKELFRIVDNEWIGPIDVWDVEQVGCRLTIRSASRGIVFEAIKDNEKSSLTITTLDMYFAPFHVVLKPDLFLVGQYDESVGKSVYFEVAGTFEYGDCALYLDSTRASELRPSELKIIGGRGMWLEGTGMWVGFGSGRMLLRQFKLHNNGCEAGIAKKVIKSITPCFGQNYFVTGKLETRLIEHPLWTENIYFLNGQKLYSKPFSWGKVGEVEGDDVELFHISRSEPEDLAKNSGFIGFYADDVLAQEWSDSVFEVDVEDCSDEGTFVCRAKITEVGGRRVVTEGRERPFHPQQFAGECPWKAK